MKQIKLDEMAKLLRVSIKTLQRWDNDGKLVAKRSPTNRRYYIYEQYLEYIGINRNCEEKLNIAYIRVSTLAQKSDLENQKKAVEQFCISSGIPINEWYEDIGSGLNFKRKNFNKLFEMIENREVDKVIIAHKDRLVRFGYEWFESFANRHNTKIITINAESLSPQEEMVKDLMAIIHVFSARFYGLRNYKRKIKDAIGQKDRT